MAGDRGRKALAVHFAETKAAPPEQPVLPSEAIPATVEAIPATEQETIPATEEEQMCDVLSEAEFIAELTELLLNAVPPLTGQQILEVRRGMLESARKRGWVDA